LSEKSWVVMYKSERTLDGWNRNETKGEGRRCVSFDASAFPPSEQLKEVDSRQLRSRKLPLRMLLKFFVTSPGDLAFQTSSESNRRRTREREGR